MKRDTYKLSLVAFAAAAVFAACTGPSGNGLPAGTSPAARMAPDKASSALVIRHVYAGLSFDGANFTVDSHKSCGHRGLGGLTAFVASAGAQLVLNGSPSLTPVCVPNPAPSTAPLIYIFAVARHKGAHSAHWSGVPIAGPANLTDNPWVFAPLSPGLTMIAGQKYDFVVATSWQHPSPEPSASSSP